MNSDKASDKSQANSQPSYESRLLRLSPRKNSQQCEKNLSLETEGEKRRVSGYRVALADEGAPLRFNLVSFFSPFLSFCPEFQRCISPSYIC